MTEEEQGMMSTYVGIPSSAGWGREGLLETRKLAQRA